jgi:succinate dehydrogenase/fumarate reductase-like Fe-S protein
MLVRVPQRAFTSSADLQRFLDTVGPEGYTPLLQAERAAMPATMRCINCGLCALACPSLQQSAAGAWDDAWTFVSGPSRSIDRASLVAASITPCAECDECTAVCPTGVPIPHLVALVRRMSA